MHDLKKKRKTFFAHISSNNKTSAIHNMKFHLMLQIIKPLCNNQPNAIITAIQWSNSVSSDGGNDFFFPQHINAIDLLVSPSIPVLTSPGTVLGYLCGPRWRRPIDLCTQQKPWMHSACISQVDGRTRFMKCPLKWALNFINLIWSHRQHLSCRNHGRAWW